MPKAIVISAYRDKRTGRYVHPSADQPVEVDLHQEDYDRLIASRCIKGKPGRPRKASNVESEAPKPVDRDGSGWPPGAAD